MDITDRYKRLAVWGAAATIIVIILFLVSLYLGPAKDGQQEIKANRQESPDEVDKNVKTGEKPNRLIKRMQYIGETFHKELMQYYPLGYTLFAIIDGAEIVTLNEDHSPQRYDIEWDTARIYELTEEYITITFSGLYDNETGNSFLNPRLHIVRKIGAPHRILRIEDLNIIAELIVDDSEGMICLFGFKQDEQ